MAFATPSRCSRELRLNAVEERTAVEEEGEEEEEEEEEQQQQQQQQKTTQEEILRVPYRVTGRVQGGMTSSIL